MTSPSSPARKASPSASTASADSPDGWEELVTGTVQIVCVNLEKMKSAPIPEFLRTKLEALQ